MTYIVSGVVLNYTHLIHITDDDYYVTIVFSWPTVFGNTSHGPRPNANVITKSSMNGAITLRHPQHLISARVDSQHELIHVTLC